MIATVAAMKPRRDRKAAVTWSDSELIQACLGGNQDAWNELVDRYGRLVYSITRRCGLSEADSDDVFQEVFMILYRKLHALRDPSRVSAWLIRITHRECHRVGKRYGRHASLEEIPADAGAPANEYAASQEQQHLVRQALRQLGGRSERLLTALFSGCGQPGYKAVAVQLDMTAGSIGPTRARCFKKLEAILIEMGLDGTDEGAASDPLKEQIPV